MITEKFITIIVKTIHYNEIAIYSVCTFQYHSILYNYEDKVHSVG